MILTQQYLSDDDRQFMGELYEQYKTWMIFRVGKYVDAKDCEEVVQTCITKLIEHVGTLRRLDEANRMAYIAVALDHHALNHIRKEARLIKTNAAESADLHFIEDEDNLVEMLERKLDMQAIMDNIQYLPERDQQLLKLRYALELSDKQISEITGINQNSVRMTVKRSVLKLQKEIKKRRGLE